MMPGEAIVLAAALIIAAIVSAWYLARTLHAVRYDATHARHARHALADPADVGDPDGTRYVAELHHEPDDADWWDQEPPPQRTPEPEDFRATRWVPPPQTVMARVLDRLRDVPPPPRLDDTAPIPHAVGTWGKTPAQIADELAEKYLAAPR